MLSSLSYLKKIWWEQMQKNQRIQRNPIITTEKSICNDQVEYKKPYDELASLIKSIEKPQTWLAITEDWCGDSAQNLPYIAKYLELNPKLKLVVALRDENLDAIDNYFVEGNPRSIPKIVIFDEDANELFVWGSRPKFAQDLVQQLKAEGYAKEEFNKELHLWYGKNRGKELEKELLNLFSKMK